jgi:acyl-coenzyme A thioesterase 13
MSADIIQDGDFAGWTRFERSGGNGEDGYIGLLGPYYYHSDETGQIKVAFKAEARHLNGGGTVHGGCLLSLADSSLFAFCVPYLEGGGAVTMQLDSKFLSPGHQGDILIASGRVVRAGGSVIFAEGQVTCEGKPLLAFSGIMKRTRKRGGDS